jgi:hypothetical protein
MQTGTTRPNEPAGTERVVQTDVETVRSQQAVPNAPVTPGAPQGVTETPMATTQSSRTVVSRSSGGYFNTLPERLGAVGLVILTALEGLLGMRFLLLAFGANPSSGFVEFIKDVSWPFVRPFSNIFNNRTWDQGIIETSTLVAMGVYFLVFALIGMLVTALAPRLNADADTAV